MRFGRATSSKVGPSDHPRGPEAMSNVHVVDHPLVQHKLTLMRDKTVSTKGFRQLLNEIGMLLAYEVTRDLPMEMVEVETPLAKTMQPTIAGKKLVFAPILRAGVGFLDGMLNLVPSARVAHIGLYRDPKTLEAVEYYFKAPTDVADRLVIVMDPMLATANSAVAAIDRLKRRGVQGHPLRLPARRARGHRAAGQGPSRRADLDRGDRREAQRPRLHRARPRRRRRPDVRDEIEPPRSPEPTTASRLEPAARFTDAASRAAFEGPRGLRPICDGVAAARGPSASPAPSAPWRRRARPSGNRAGDPTSPGIPRAKDCTGCADDASTT